jgi:hypothetical protein
MRRINRHPGGGSSSSCRDQKNPIGETAAAQSQKITRRARTRGCWLPSEQNYLSLVRGRLMVEPPTPNLSSPQPHSPADNGHGRQGQA